MIPSSSERFPISFGRLRWLLFALGILPRWSHVLVDDATEEVFVQLGWVFHLRAKLGAVARVAPYEGRVAGWGAHGWNGRWLVNGSAEGLVQIDFQPRTRGYVLGWPVKVRVLVVSVEEPGELMIALTTPTT